MDMGIRADGGTHPGKMRQHNEDAFYLTQPNGTVDPAALARAGYLFVVADGVGGNRGGARASELAVGRLPAAYYGLTGGDPAHSLRLAFDGVAREIVAEAVANPERSNMSCTVVAAVLRDNVATIAHLGDARAYLLRGGLLQPLTSDHTWVQMQVEKGTLTPAEAENHPERNVITKSMGNPALPEPTLRQVALQDGDRLLLCSDGLCGVATDAEIAAVLNRAADPTAAIKPLIDLANRKGGPDNVTAVVVQAGRAGAAAAGGGRKGGGVWPVLLPVLAAALVGLFFLFRPGGGNGPSPTAAATAGAGMVVAAVEVTQEPTNAAATSTAAAVGAQATEMITPTATLQAAAAATATAPLATAAVTVVFRPSAAATPYELQPSSCAGNQSFARNDVIPFSWRWDGQIEDCNYLEIRVRQVSIGRVDTSPDPATGRWLWNVPASDLNRDPGDYQWQVAYIGNGGQVLSQSAAGCFTLTGGGGGSGPQPEETATTAPPTIGPTEQPTTAPSPTEPPPPTKTPGIGD